MIGRGRGESREAAITLAARPDVDAAVFGHRRIEVRVMPSERRPHRPGASSHRAVLPSTSVRRNVIVPLGSSAMPSTPVPNGAASG